MSDAAPAILIVFITILRKSLSPIQLCPDYHSASLTTFPQCLPWVSSWSPAAALTSSSTSASLFSVTSRGIFMHSTLNTSTSIAARNGDSASSLLNRRQVFIQRESRVAGEYMEQSRQDWVGGLVKVAWIWQDESENGDGDQRSG